MTMLPLAVYTAEHGLNWTYPRAEISFAELDACRKALGNLPDFDSGEPGYEGIWATHDKVFAIRCQSVKAWDFRGRDATYLAVTWMPREETVGVDFESLLRSNALCIPAHKPEPFFEVRLDRVRRMAEGQELSLLTDFRAAAGVIANAAGKTVRLRRTLGAAGVSVSIDRIMPTAAPMAGHMPYDVSEPRQVHSVTDRPSSRPSGLYLPWKLAIPLILWALIATIGLVVLALNMPKDGWRTLSTRLNTVSETVSESPVFVKKGLEKFHKSGKSERTTPNQTEPKQNSEPKTRDFCQTLFGYDSGYLMSAPISEPKMTIMIFERTGEPHTMITPTRQTYGVIRIYREGKDSHE